MREESLEHAGKCLLAACIVHDLGERQMLLEMAGAYLGLSNGQPPEDEEAGLTH